jgi:aminopeptidase N
MIRKNVLIAATFFAAILFTISSFAQPPGPGFNRKQTYDAQHYKIESSFDRAKHEVYADTTVTLKPLAANFTTVDFDAVGLSFTKVTLEPSGANLKYTSAEDKVTVTLDRAYGPSDTISIRLISTARPKKGVYFVDPLVEGGAEQRSPQIWTQGEPDEARHWFPSFDFPSDKATTEQIITTEKENTVIANGELLSKNENANGTVTWHYKMPVPHSVYLLSFVIGKYVKVEDKYKDIPLGFYIYPGREQLATKAYGTTKDMIQVFENLTGVNFPYNKYDQTTVSSFQFGGMENITATTMADTEIAMANVDFLRPAVDDLVSHELAHSWFGNLVTCRNWAELWLNEGFATFMEAAYREKKYNRANYIQKVNEDAEQFMTEDATVKNNHGLYNLHAGNVATLFDRSGVTYNKGGAVIHTLREQVGDETFWKAINLYLNRHKFANVESTDLLAAMEETSKQELDWFFKQWVYGIGYPKLNVTPVWNPAKKTLTLTVNQTQSAVGLNTAAYRLPMSVEFRSGNTEPEKRDIVITKRVETFTYKLPRKPTSIAIDKDSRIPIKTVKVTPIR